MSSMDNHIYNLIKSSIKRSESIWKYQQYKEDSQGCLECQKLWDTLKQIDEQALSLLKQTLESHAKEGMLK